MHLSSFQALACPLDGKPLIQAGGGWRCAEGHSFDIAKQGYVNLLPVQHKRSTDPGDSKTMVAARRRFLNAGYYQPVAEAVSRHVQRHAQRNSERSEDERARHHASGEAYACLDAGCGEGYYLRQIGASLSGQELSLVGVDISKWAVQAAAKQAKALATWVVGSNAHLPMATSTLDCVLCMFGFPVTTEFARVLKPGGLLVQVEAGSDHLRELREVIYPTLKPERPVSAEPLAGFSLFEEEALSYKVALEDAGTIADLLSMTPHLYRASSEGRERAAALDSLTLTVDVRLTLWQAEA